MKNKLIAGALVLSSIFLGIPEAKAHYDEYNYNHGHVCTAYTSLNVRSSFSTSSSVKGSVAKGAQVQIVGSYSNWETEEYWYQIEYAGSTGWVRGDYICF